jgi:RNA polymerase sigma factor (TIGR02999 family)
MLTGQPSEITVLLRRWRSGDPAAYDLLVERTHRRLLAIASALGARERGDNAPDELVSEAYLRLRQLQRIQWQNREHFFSFAATEIRRVLITRARDRLAQKRGGGLERVLLDENVAWIELPATQILDLNLALEELKEREPELIRLIELHYLMGYSLAETAELEGVSESAIERHLRFARAWLNRRLLEERL